VASALNNLELVSQKANALDTRLTSASKEVDAIEKNVVAQGPRWKLLKSAAPDLVKKLSPFVGQKVELFVCGTKELAKLNREMMSTWGAVAEILNADGAKWSVLHGGLEYWDPAPFSCEGMKVNVNSHAPQRTMLAAKVLSDGLAKTLPPTAGEILATIDGDWGLQQIKLGVDEHAPWVSVVKDPDLITVSIAEHPETEPSKKITSQTK
jgi:hypothetical protein